jgi:hypothetical protein
MVLGRFGEVKRLEEGNREDFGGDVNETKVYGGRLRRDGELGQQKTHPVTSFLSQN